MNENPLNYREKEYYNKVFKEATIYKVHYSICVYINIWKSIFENYISKFDKNTRIIDIGCGPGQFGSFLFDKGYKNYLGIDFSEEAINMAKLKNNQKYELMNYKNVNFNNFDLMIALESLEHLENDLDLIQQIPLNRDFIFSVPSFFCDGHVRIYNEKIIRTRFENYLYINDLKEIKYGKDEIYIGWCKKI